jgi:site-specific DNA-methyltransferase (adenine-specific)
MDRQSGGTDNGASRFFTRFDAEPPFAYIAKPSTAERERGLEHRARVKVNDGRAATADNPRLRGETQRGNTHPTVKPIAIMRWLVRLVCRPGALVLDPFAGSGTTGIAALAEGCRFVGVELDETHAEIARARIQAWAPGAKQDDGAKQADDDAEDARQLGLFA